MFEQIAYAQGTAQQAPPEASPLALFFPFIVVFAIMYFLIWRPQQKHRKELQKTIDNLKKGDRIVTIGGMIGTVTSIQKDYVVIKVGSGENATKIEILKSAISGLRT